MLQLFNTNSQLFGSIGQLGFFVLFTWSLVWKGLALWHASKRDEKWWFIAFLLVQTVGILEIVYLVFVAKVLPRSVKKRTNKRT